MNAATVYLLVMVFSNGVNRNVVDIHTQAFENPLTCRAAKLWIVDQMTKRPWSSSTVVAECITEVGNGNSILDRQDMN